MSEIISLGLGNAGCNILQKSFELFSIEHDISNDGHISALAAESDNKSKMYQLHQNDIYRPRAIFVDSDPQNLEDIQTSVFRDAYSQDQFITGNFGSCCTYSNGYSMKEQLKQVSEAICKQLESCDQCEGFLTFNSCGGFSSGFTSLLSESLSDEHAKKVKINFEICDSEYQSTPYSQINSLFSNCSLHEYTNCTFMIGNDALDKICTYNYIPKHSSFLEFNQIIAHAVSSTTSSLRFDSSYSQSLADMEANFVQFPQLKYLFQAVSPLMSNNLTYECINSIQLCDQNILFEKKQNWVTKEIYYGLPEQYPRRYMTHPVTELVYNCLESDASNYPKSQLLRCETLGRHQSAHFVLTGDVLPTEIRSDLYARVRKMMKFLEWGLQKLNIAAHYTTVKQFSDDCIKYNDRMCCVTHNSCSMKDIYQNLREKVENNVNEREISLGYEMEEKVLLDAIEWSKQLESEYNEIVRKEGDLLRE